MTPRSIATSTKPASHIIVTHDHRITRYRISARRTVEHAATGLPHHQNLLDHHRQSNHHKPSRNLHLGQQKVATRVTSRHQQIRKLWPKHANSIKLWPMLIALEMKKVSLKIHATNTDSTVRAIKNQLQQQQHRHCLPEQLNTVAPMLEITVKCAVGNDLLLQGHCSFAEDTMQFVQHS